MRVDGEHRRTIWLSDDHDEPGVVYIIDQRQLPHAFVVEELRSVDEVADAIRDMHVRGAGLIGATAAAGMYLAGLGAAAADFVCDECDVVMEVAAEELKATRPTAVNLAWAVDRQLAILAALGPEAGAEERAEALRVEAQAIADEDAEMCRSIGTHGVEIIRDLSAAKNGETVNIMTHCNAGWLAFVDYGSATSPMYQAFDEGIDIHVWVSETRPRNQGGRLTAWELGQHGISHTVIADNVSGHLMQHGLVDLVIVGSDRTTKAGYVANKIGTYMKALAANDNGVPFYVALPSSTIDWTMDNGLEEIPIEERGAGEVTHMRGLLCADDPNAGDEAAPSAAGELARVRLTPAGSPAKNFGFDVTPPRLVTGLITERGVCPATADGIASLFPDGGGSAPSDNAGEGGSGV